MSFLEKVGLSILVSISTVIVFAIGKVLSERFMENVIGRLIPLTHDLRGSWSATYEDDNGIHIDEEWKVAQFATWLSGMIRYVETPSSNDPTRVAGKPKYFGFRGILRNQIVTIYYYNSDRKYFGSGCHCLQVIDDGDQLTGVYAIWDSRLQRVIVGPKKPIVYERVNGRPWTINPFEILFRRFRRDSEFNHNAPE